MPFERPVVRRPDQGSGLVDDQIGLGLAAVGSRIVPARKPVGSMSGKRLVPEAFRVGAAGKAMHVEGPPTQIGQQVRSDLGRVAQQIALRHRGLAGKGRKQDLVQVGDPQFASEDRPLPGRRQRIQRGQVVFARRLGLEQHRSVRCGKV